MPKKFYIPTDEEVAKAAVTVCNTRVNSSLLTRSGYCSTDQARACLANQFGKTVDGAAVAASMRRLYPDSTARGYFKVI